MKLKSLHPFSFYNCYLIFHEKQNRKYVLLVNLKYNKRITISFARFLMSVFLKRELQINEHVHHKNGNKQEDRIGNLQIVCLKEHGKLHRTGRLFITTICPVCFRSFSVEKRQTHFSTSTKSVTCCSFICSRSLVSLSKTQREQLKTEQFILKEEYKII